MPVYSHSRLNCFEQCPLKFKYQYIDKLETEIENSIEAFMGSRVHEALEKLYNDLRFSKLNKLKGLLEFYRKSWDLNFTEGIVIVRKQFTADNYKKMGEKFITDYYSKYFPFNQGRTIGLEHRILLKIKGYTLQGFIDRLAAFPGGVYEIHDYKTSNSLPTQDQIDQDRQLALYSIAIRQNYKDCRKVVLVWHYLAFDKELRSERSDQDLEQLKAEVLELIERIENTREFPAKQSALCGWCEFQMICPNFKHLYRLNEISENEYKKEPGLNLVNEYSKLKAESDAISVKLEKIKEALVAFAQKEGINNVYGSDYVAFVKQYPRLTFPKKNDPQRKSFEETIKKIGLWDKLATVDVYELAKMINNDELHTDLKNLLQLFIQPGKTNYIRLRKK